jgi:hypothetical protein
MIYHEAPFPTHVYRVRLGHYQVRVSGRDPHEAVQAARRQLCEELPRMWDVIHQTHDDRFVIDELDVTE